MELILNFCRGLLIGAGAILPGISSGVLCVVFGIYEKLVNSVINFFKDIKKNFKFLLPIGIGGFLGIILFGNILKFLFSTYSMQSYFLFIGLIIGTVPIMFKQANKKGFKLHYILYAITTFIFSVFLILLEKNINNSVNSYTNFSIFNYIVSGALMSAGVVIPGLSSTVILMMLGIYSTYLSAISSVNIQILLPMAIGLGIGGILFLKLIQVLFKKAYSQTYYSIIGFSLGSILVMYPGFSFNATGLVSVLCLILGFFISSRFEK